ncbi:ribonuclease J [candidate division Kazan bacterium RIFCSPLOWO2_01_FULL_48_13]|uniref:Ribonuclease J n=1 Tax=candidate division Kazan bacterium RIFCSPLOWO2_01_FULL_48_13 TaxID=1798539 RepID=A0A1F4PNN1_UNCK3|nr:MAG: ribonuclease J [candidate division Kazan bacterium RIFCSPLOWO2_01_FULL_48_13]
MPLGGFGEIGKNMTLLEYGNDLIAIDCGMMFPDETMLGIDYVIPDATYLRKNRAKFRGIVITHGHEDHIGAIPHIVPELSVPVYASPLAKALIETRLGEYKGTQHVKINAYQPNDEIRLGVFKIRFFRVNHSIPDSFGIIIDTPEGVVVHTGDFKIDLTSPDGLFFDLAKLKEVGRHQPLLLLSESTNSDTPGHTISEKAIGESFNELFAKANGRIIIASFASRIDRMQHALNAAVKFGRRVTISGRSMLQYFEAASKLGYIKYPREILVPLKEISKIPDAKLVVLSTGSQGQQGSSLARMAFREHSQVKIKPGDTVALSSSPIPGNERSISSIINNLCREGAEVIHNRNMQIHTTGHAYQEELKTILQLVKPRFFIPIHGEYHMRVSHKKLALGVGVPEADIFLLENGDIMEFHAGKARKLKDTIPAGIVMVDGLGVGDVGEIVLRDRQAMAKEGMFVIIATIERKSGKLVNSPDLISRGFVYMREQEELVNRTRMEVKQIIGRHSGKAPEDWSNIRQQIREEIGNFLYRETQRRPLIIPVIIEV